jgi:ribosomal protein S18 acetylase RimI-like enzyme
MTVNIMFKKMYTSIVLILIPCLFFNGIISYASDLEKSTLSPRLLFSDTPKSADMKCTLICALIEARANWGAKSIEEIYYEDMLRWKESTERDFQGFEPKLSSNKNEIIIKLPGTDLVIRYYNSDPVVEKTLTPGTNWKETKTNVIIKNQINRQIIHTSQLLKVNTPSPSKKPLQVFDNNGSLIISKDPDLIQGATEQVQVVKMTKDFAKKHVKKLVALMNTIPDVKWVDQQLLDEAWAPDNPYERSPREFTKKWKHSVAIVDEQDIPIGLLIAYERPKDEEISYKDKDSLYIHGFAVDEKYKKRGLGKIMMHTVAQNLHNFNSREKDDNIIPSITLKFDRNSAYLLDTYEKLGFEKIGEKLTLYDQGNNHDDYVMAGEVQNIVNATATPEEKYAEFLKENHLIKLLLQDSLKDIILRVPIEKIERMDKNEARSFFKAFQHNNSNGYIELFYASGEGEVNANAYTQYGLRAKPAGFKYSKENTITLMPAFKSEISPSAKQAKRDLDHLIATRIGSIETQIVPIGYQNDTAGIVRGALLGMAMIHLAREKSQGHKSNATLINNTYVNSILNFYNPEDISKAGLTAQDIVDLATGEFDKNIASKVLVKLIKLLPIEPIDARQIFENTRQTLIAA